MNTVNGRIPTIMAVLQEQENATSVEPERTVTERIRNILKSVNQVRDIYLVFKVPHLLQDEICFCPACPNRIQPVANKQGRTNVVLQ